MTPDYLAAVTIIRQREKQALETAAKRSKRLRGAVRLAIVLNALCALLWAFYRIGFEAGLVSACATYLT